MTGTIRRAAALSVVTALLIAPAPSSAYLKSGFQVGDRTVSLRWQRTPVRYFVTDRAVPGVNAIQFRDTLARAFASWQDLPTASITFEFAGFTAANPGDGDSLSTLGFRPRPDLERVLAQTNSSSTRRRARSSSRTSCSIRRLPGQSPRPASPAASTSNRSRCTRSAICWAWGIPRLARRRCGPAASA